MRAMIACAFVFVACSGNPSARQIGGGGTACPSAMDGILFIDWTIHGNPASTSACNGVDKISLFLTNPACGEVEIDPIPCTLDKFRYDDMPIGTAEIVLQGVDTRGDILISGSNQVDLTATLPAKPTTIALQ